MPNFVFQLLTNQITYIDNEDDQENDEEGPFAEHFFKYVSLISSVKLSQRKERRFKVS